VSDGLGFSLETTRKTLTKLFEQRMSILKTMEDEGYIKGPFGRMRPRAKIERQALLTAQLEQVDHHIAETRD
jgi:DNA-binding transcriptional MerR regulator